MKILRSSSIRRAEAALYLVVFFLILLFSAMTPMLADDYSYCFSWVDNARVRSLGQIIPSMAVHRNLTNGRVFTHALVQFLLMFPRGLFALLNAGAALLLLFLFRSYLGRLSSPRRALLLSAGALLLWDVTPVFGQVFLWLDGAVNYGWGLCLLLLFLRPYAVLWLSGEDARPLWRRLMFIVLAFLAGTWSESASPAVFLAALCLLLLSALRDHKPDLFLLTALAAELFGILFLLLAPATRGRASIGFDLSSLVSNLKAVLLQSKAVMLPLYLLYAGTLVPALSRSTDRRSLILSGILLLSAIAALLAYTVAAYFTSRHFCFAVCVTVLAELVLLAELLRAEQPLLPRLVTAGALVWALFLFPLGALDIAVTYKHFREREAAIQQALDAGETEIRLEIYVPATPYSAPYQLEDLSPEPHVWPNGSLEYYYGIGSIYGVEPAEAEAPLP